MRADHDADALVALERSLDAALARHGAGLVGGNLAAVEGAEWYSLALVGDSPGGAAREQGMPRPRISDAIPPGGQPRETPLIRHLC